MATHVLTDVDIYTNQYDFASQLNQVELTGEAESVDVTNFGSAGWKEFKGGLKSGMVNYSGFASYGAGEIGSVLEPIDGLIGTTGILVTVTDQSPAENSVAFSMSSLQTTLSNLGQVGEANPISAQFVADGNRGILAGRLIAAKADRTSTATSTGYQLGAVTATQRIYSAFHVFSATGTSPTLDMVVESDNASNFASATSRITHTQRTAAGFELSSLGGAVTDDYWRASWTIGGTDTPTFSFALVLAIVNV
jgi:hypothetical protein